MTTQARIAANRRNATRSTGPRTTTGKARASTNAVTHGLTARLDVMLPGEDPAACQAFGAGMLAELAPVGTVERFYAQRAVWLAWRLSRVPGIESAVLSAASAEIRRDEALDDMRAARDRAFHTTESLVSQVHDPERESPEPLTFARALRDRLIEQGPKLATEGLSRAERRKRKERLAQGEVIASFPDRGAQAAVNALKRRDDAQKTLSAEPVLSGRAFAVAASRGTWDALGRYERTLTRDLERTIAALRTEQARRMSGSN